MNPIVSVALPVYNGERFLFEAVSSVFAQSLSDFELIIVDDGSTDRTPAIVSRFAQSDARVRVIRNDTNKGIIPSLNSGIETARAPFIARMDADDRMHPERLAEQVAFLEKNTDIDVVSCLVEKFSVNIPVTNDRYRLGYCLYKYMKGEGDKPEILVNSTKIKITGITKEELAKKLDAELANINS